MPRTGRTAAGSRHWNSITHETQAMNAPNDTELRPLLRRCIDDWLRARIGTVPAYDDDSSLLALGLDSLAVVGLAIELGDALGIAIPDEALFDHPNIAALAAWLQQGVTKDEALP